MGLLDGDVRLSSAAVRRRIQRDEYRGAARSEAMAYVVCREVEEANERREALRALDREGRERRERRRAAAGASVVFTLRLSRSELEFLEQRADAIGIRPSKLARNLIRHGLRDEGSPDLGRMLDQMDDLVAGLRTALA